MMLATQDRPIRIGSQIQDGNDVGRVVAVIDEWNQFTDDMNYVVAINWPDDMTTYHLLTEIK